jgi:hypothetical protein
MHQQRVPRAAEVPLAAGPRNQHPDRVHRGGDQRGDDGLPWRRGMSVTTRDLPADPADLRCYDPLGDDAYEVDNLTWKSSPTPASSRLRTRGRGRG